ncbi:MAG: BTAD domain-containing putative transcriptional regulator [Caldilineaceae bacterium]
MQLRFFGQPQLSIDGHTVDLKSRKGWALLAYLAATDRAHSRDLLATLFWPEHTQTRARGNLRRLLFTLNQSPAGAWLQADSDTIALRMTSDGQIDLWDFAAHMAEGDVIAAAALYRDDFLGGVLLGDSDDFERWATQQREFYRREVIGALENLTQAEIAGGQYGAALAHARRQLRIDPLQESAYRQAMTALALSGRRSEALLLFEQCRQQLQDALGLDPGSDTVALQARIRAGTLDAPAAAEPARGGWDVTPAPWTAGPCRPTAGLSSASAGLSSGGARRRTGPDRVAVAAGARRPWQHAPAGRGTGNGKSRLVEEVLHKVADDGGHALRATCFQMEQAMPYHPIIDLVEQIRRVQPPEFWRGCPPAP